MGAGDKTPSPITHAFLSGKAALIRYVRRLSKQIDPEDAVQETFIRAYKKEQLSVIDNPDAYLYKIAKNVVLNEMRSISRRPTDYLDDFDADEVYSDDWTLYQQLETEELIGLHCSAIALLPRRCREVYILKKIYGFSRAEIAQKLAISESTVEGHLTRGYSHCDKYIMSRLSVSESPRNYAGKREAGTKE